MQRDFLHEAALVGDGARFLRMLDLEKWFQDEVKRRADETSQQNGHKFPRTLRESVKQERQAPESPPPLKGPVDVLIDMLCRVRFGPSSWLDEEWITRAVHFIVRQPYVVQTPRELGALSFNAVGGNIGEVDSFLNARLEEIKRWWKKWLQIKPSRPTHMRTKTAYWKAARLKAGGRSWRSLAQELDPEGYRADPQRSVQRIRVGVGREKAELLRAWKRFRAEHPELEYTQLSEVLEIRPERLSSKEKMGMDYLDQLWIERGGPADPKPLREFLRAAITDCCNAGLRCPRAVIARDGQLGRGTWRPDHLLSNPLLA